MQVAKMVTPLQIETHPSSLYFGVNRDLTHCVKVIETRRRSKTYTNLDCTYDNANNANLIYRTEWKQMMIIHTLEILSKLVD